MREEDTPTPTHTHTLTHPHTHTHTPRGQKATETLRLLVQSDQPGTVILLYCFSEFQQPFLSSPETVKTKPVALVLVFFLFPPFMWGHLPPTSDLLAQQIRMKKKEILHSIRCLG